MAGGIPHPSRITPACAGKTDVSRVGGQKNWDHPRMRGEDFWLILTDFFIVGSPPHARGRPTLRDIDIFSTGITPACAGKTRTSPYPQPFGNGSPPHARGRPAERIFSGKDTADHPRMRGEDFSARSPPPPTTGITPACAGKTPVAYGNKGRCMDHPRMRGEDSAFEARASFSTGSPPHARGRLTVWRHATDIGRITPACAGKTKPTPNGTFTIWDHPRMRGEDTYSPVSLSFVWGSPPHARGRQDDILEMPRRTGITPACAGKTCVPQDRVHSVEDHPRMRGEDRFATTLVRRSSWITPACAGKTMPEATLLYSTTDHPRMRGEDLPPRSCQTFVFGSPPHARGRHRAEYQARRTRRITPACAGKTQSEAATFFM